MASSSTHQERPTVKAGALLVRVAAYLVPYRGTFALALLGVVTIAALELLKPWPLKIVVDSVLGEAPPPLGVLAGWSRAALLGLACVALVVIHAGLAVLVYANNRVTISIGQQMVSDLQSDLYQHLQRLSLAFHANRNVGDLLYRLTADTYSVQALTMNGVFSLASSGLFLVGMTVVLAWIEPILALVALAIVPVLYLCIQRMNATITEQSTLAREHESGLYTMVQRGLSAIRVVQAFTQEETEHQRFLDQSRTSLAASRRLYLVQTLYAGVVNTIVAAGTAAVLWFGASRVLSGAMSVGDVLVFLGYLASLYAPVAAASHTIGVVQAAMAGIRRVFELLDERETVVSGPRALERSAVRGEITFDRVSFSYDGDRRVLDDVSLNVPPGSTVALVGPTGAGKTTLVSLISRFYDPSGGRVLLDGTDLRELDLGDLRRAIAMVLQPPIVFAATLRENIAYGRPGARPEEIENAAAMAQLTPLLVRLPQGLDTPIGEGGATVSEGEKQRLTIARALLRDAPILILDEPTASLDAETESLLMAGLRSLVTGRTTFLIAHRLATVREADLILVLRDGRIAESGSYAALLRQQGFFARLVQLQDGLRSADAAV
jgi:ATP-binding cassette, subfamily B, bacterial